MSEIEITPADWDAVYAFARTGHAKGTSSFQPLAALFAAHRIQARKEALDEAAKVAEAMGDDLRADGTRPRPEDDERVICDAVMQAHGAFAAARAIRQLSHHNEG